MFVCMLLVYKNEYFEVRPRKTYAYTKNYVLLSWYNSSYLLRAKFNTFPIKPIEVESIRFSYTLDKRYPALI